MPCPVMQIVRNNHMDDFLRRSVMGFPVVVGTVSEVAQELGAMAVRIDRPYGVSAADVHVITRGLEDLVYGRVVQGMDLICPDGMPLVKLLNRDKKPDDKVAQRVSGPDLMDAMLGLDCPGQELKHFFLGSTDETLALLTQKTREKYPFCHIVGSYSPPFGIWDDAEYDRMIALIRKSGANVVWVGLGCPKQEQWIAHCKPFLPPAIYLAVGAAFDFHAGTVKRAPIWMQQSSLEWLYRLIREPRRLFKRYLRYNTLFLYYLLTGKKITS